MSNVDIGTSCPPTSLSIVGDTKTSLEVSKTLENGTVPDCPYLSSILRISKSRKISYSNDSISKTNSSNEEKDKYNAIGDTIGKSQVQWGQGDTASDQQPTQKQDLLSPVIAKYPDMSHPEIRSLVKSLLTVYGRAFTMSNVEWLEYFYNQAGLSLWKFIRGESQGRIIPQGMNISGVYFAGCSGAAIPMGKIFGNRETEKP